MSTATKNGTARGVWRPTPGETLQRVILPSQSQMDTVPLYMDTGTATGMQLPTSNLDRTASR